MNTLRLWNLSTLLAAEDSGETSVHGTLKGVSAELKAYGGAVKCLSFTASGKSIRQHTSAYVYGGAVKCLSFTASGKTLCSGSADDLLRVYVC